MDITDSVAIVTGGASGLGLATTRRLVEAGARVVAVDLPSTADAAAATTDDLGDRVTFAAADVTDPDELAAAVEAAAQRGELRAAVACAGVATPGRVVRRGDPLALADFARVVTINLVGTFNLMRLAAAAMLNLPPIGEERGVLVSTASAAAFDGQIGQAAYAASKAGVAGLTLPVARDLAEHRIRVVSVAPGIFSTPMLAGLPEDAQRSLGAQVPHPSRLGRPEEYAALVEHIIANPMLNGETIRLDGAIRMAPR